MSLVLLVKHGPVSLVLLVKHGPVSLVLLVKHGPVSLVLLVKHGPASLVLCHEKAHRTIPSYQLQSCDRVSGSNALLTTGHV